MTISKKQKSQLLKTINLVSSKVLGWQILPTRGNKFLKANLKGEAYVESRPKVLVLLGAEVVEESREVFQDVPKNDPNYMEYVPIIDRLESALDGDYDILNS